MATFTINIPQMLASIYHTYGSYGVVIKGLCFVLFLFSLNDLLTCHQWPACAKLRDMFRSAVQNGAQNVWPCRPYLKESSQLQEPGMLLVVPPKLWNLKPICSAWISSPPVPVMRIPVMNRLPVWHCNVLIVPGSWCVECTVSGWAQLFVPASNRHANRRFAYG